MILLTILVALLIGFVAKLCGLMTLLGLSSTTYYFIFFLWGMAVGLINLAKGKGFAKLKDK